jgi:hypothetical protein
MLQRINPRLLTFAGIVLLAIGMPVYIYVDTTVSGGIWNAKDDRGSYKLVDLKAISQFEMDQVSATDADIPAKYRALDGQRVLLQGEMYLARMAGPRLTEFDLVYSIKRCCVVGSPKIQHFVKARMLGDKAADYTVAQVKVMGTMHVGIVKEDGHIASLYRLDVESINPVK